LVRGRVRFRWIGGICERRFRGWMDYPIPSEVRGYAIILHMFCIDYETTLQLFPVSKTMCTYSSSNFLCQDSWKYSWVLPPFFLFEAHFKTMEAVNVNVVCLWPVVVCLWMSSAGVLRGELWCVCVCMWLLSAWRGRRWGGLGCGGRGMPWRRGRALLRWWLVVWLDDVVGWLYASVLRCCGFLRGGWHQLCNRYLSL